MTLKIMLNWKKIKKNVLIIIECRGNDSYLEMPLLLHGPMFEPKLFTLHIADTLKMQMQQY